ncbi:MAG: hypothetical protein ACXVPU_09405 [Bacteroidia bacterium]
MNLKTHTLIVFVLFAITNLKAQDTLYKTNGSKIIVKIIEINSSNVKYKMLGSDSEVVVTENKNNIHHIAYANGLREFYNTTAQVNTVSDPHMTNNIAVNSSEALVKSPEEKKYGKNIIAINFFETIFTNFGMSYERVFRDGYVSLKIPVSVGLGGRPNINAYDATSSYNVNMDYLTNKIFGTGLEINAYPVKFKRSAFYIGVTTEYGQFHYYSYTNAIYPDYSQTLQRNTGIHYGGMFHIGENIGLSNHIIMGAKMGMGYKYEETIFQDYTRFKVALDLNLAYRF